MALKYKILVSLLSIGFVTVTILSTVNYFRIQHALKSQPTTQSAQNISLKSSVNPQHTPNNITQKANDFFLTYGGFFIAMLTLCYGIIAGVFTLILQFTANGLKKTEEKTINKMEEFNETIQKWKSQRSDHVKSLVRLNDAALYFINFLIPEDKRIDIRLFQSLIQLIEPDEKQIGKANLAMSGDPRVIPFLDFIIFHNPDKSLQSDAKDIKEFILDRSQKERSK